ncbi:unnamed protein product [Cylindrotheca closterium]|uniref:Uncharacterized protein n=1 Tax=Cylindrotheca closterium TaxID=2856 RepID=A0AAD2CDJ4_9STRA|nr:unnamed protein product [Cylindrotheca closterium]
MPPKKKARLKLEQNSVFVVTAATTKDQIPNDVTIVRVDESVRVLPDGIFEYCIALEEVTFEEGAQIIGANAFACCKALAKVKLPSTLRKILNMAFHLCLGLCTIDLPLGLKVIRGHAFTGAGLRHLEIPATVETIGPAAFKYCRQLESLILPPKLEVIEFELFFMCTELKEMKIPRTVKVIGSGAFASCSALTHIRVSPNVTSIGCREESTNSVFGGCASLRSLELPEGLETIELLPFADEDLHPFADEELEDILGWSSLVNLYLPPTQTVHDRFLNKAIPQTFQLAKVAQNWEDLATKLQNRFDGLPLHRVCYFQSYHLVEDTIQQISDILSDNPSALFETDAFGMTPLHIVALAQTPRLELLQHLASGFDVPRTKDLFGSTVLEYISKNPFEEGRHATRWLVNLLVGQRLSVLGLDRWKQELLAMKEGVLKADCASTMSRKVQSLLDGLVNLEFLEVLSLIEMVLWRIKLGENASDQGGIDRESCRVHCGISILIGNILPFLGKDNKRT